MSKKPELLLPVGNMTMLLAAIHHGADAVYIGVPHFNARGRTTDFSLNDLKEMIDLAHLYSVKVNLAFNVIIFQNEIDQVISLIREIVPLNPDSIIVQDLGLAYLISHVAPNQKIHASTQMTITNADAINLLKDLPIDRFVLGRENSLPEIEIIKKNSNKELEVFVHGALCVAYSGQCFTSESIGGRSANRGQCAQSCRLPYEIYVDNQKYDVGDKKYLVSPKDLMGLSEIPNLMKIGINSFKVEGRLKTPEYVAATAKNYRNVIDGNNFDLEKSRRELGTTYSRGFFTGWLNGVNHQKLVDGTYSAHRGIELGTIREVQKSSVIISSEIELYAGLGLLFISSLGEEIGSKIFKSEKTPKGWEIVLLQKNLKLQKNMKVYLNSDERLDAEYQKKWHSKEDKKKISVSFSINGKLNHQLSVKMYDQQNNMVESSSQSILALAKKAPTTLKFIIEELSGLGASIYKMENYFSDFEDNIFINHKELKEIKKDLIHKMNILRTSPKFDLIVKDLPYFKIDRTFGKTLLNILLRNKEQVEGFIHGYKNNFFTNFEDKIGVIVLDFEFGKDYESSLSLLKKFNFKTAIATTRILKPMEYNNLKLIMHLNPDKILVRNLGALEYLRNNTQIELFGDFSLNVSNSYAHQYLLAKGLSSICCSYDLNESQLMELLDASDPGKLEVTIHQYMPEFHMEHCVFAACLSTGSSFKDCGKPCEKHSVKLQDPYGNWHFLKADHECRNTFFKATPQSASFLIEKLVDKKIAAMRIEALNEHSTEFNEKIKTYLKLIKNMTPEKEALRELKSFEAYGLGSGQLKSPDRHVSRKIN